MNNLKMLNQGCAAFFCTQTILVAENITYVISLARMRVTIFFLLFRIWSSHEFYFICFISDVSRFHRDVKLDHFRVLNGAHEFRSTVFNQARILFAIVNERIFQLAETRSFFSRVFIEME